MANIYQRVDNYFKTFKKDAIKKAIKELKYQRLTEQFRGAKWNEKLEGIIKIIYA